MNEFLQNLLTAVITAAIPIMSAALIALINRVKEQATAQTDSIKQQGYITEIADAVSAAVAATSQTYVDSLKSKGAFTAEAQKEAAQKALDTCLVSISPAAQAFITSVYGDLTEYLVNKIEAEVRAQKLSTATTATAVLESGVDATAVAASTAAATAASVAQNTINKITSTEA